jgi:hypothetical protein
MPLVRFKRKHVIEVVGMHVYPNLKERDLRPSPLWPFYKKMRTRNWIPLEHLLEINRENGKLRSNLTYRFKHERTNRILNMHISRHEQLYFTVVDGSKVYQSDYCSDYSELDTAFCKFFKTKKPVLASKPGF